MATKKETFEGAMALCKEHNAPAKLVEALTGLLEPRSAGMKVNLAEVTKMQGDKVTHIMCSVSGKFLPATEDFFYVEKAEGKGINGLKRLSKQAESIRKTFNRQKEASKNAIISDMTAEGATPDVIAKSTKALKALETSAPDYSKVSDKLPAPEAA